MCGKEDHRGLYDATRRTIYIRRGLSSTEITATLLHEMCHVGCHYHGKQFVAKMARLNSMGAPIHEETEFKPGFYPSREAGRTIADLVPQLPEGMTWSVGRRYVAKALLLSVRDLKRQIPWAQRRWERLQREAAKERKILKRVLEVGALKDRAPGTPQIWHANGPRNPRPLVTLPDLARSPQHATDVGE